MFSNIHSTFPDSGRELGTAPWTSIDHFSLSRLSCYLGPNPTYKVFLKKSLVGVCGPRSLLYVLKVGTMLGHAFELLNQVPEKNVQTLCQVSKCTHYLLLPGEILGPVG